MPVPPWADGQLTADLKHLCAQGETQELEYKSALPKQVSDLAAEIAAFSSSNPGQILLGVADDGSVVGLAACDSQTARDQLAERVAGICRLVKPSVHPVLKWAVEGEMVVCVLQIPKGPAPMYYVGHRPYVRRLTSSRPAEPDEVIEAVRAFLANGEPPKQQDPEATKVRSETASTLGEIMRWSDLDLKDRELNPWAEYWLSEGRDLATGLRRIAAQERAEELGLTSPLRKAAAAIEKVVRHPRALGGGHEFDALIEEAGNAAREMHSEHIAHIKLDSATEKQLASQISSLYRRMLDSWRLAAEDPFTDAFDDAIKEASVVGRALHEWSFYPSGLFAGQRGPELREIAKELEALRLVSIYLDGGDSQRKVIARGNAATEALQGWRVANAKAGELVEQAN
ncbi:helix-turn-helix domain-containing protein [Roseateles sp. LYH14W]|uniref:Helix-turn-helix domain-containing protein n=1 Tax=Pelomonas parva TaxID=3299032 RepID=A0ABW7FCD3_9BURK